ncbi:hypothetical protein ANAPC1_01049 [Anaplasma phagocytophilum]|uniref:Uncharacterized protein n=1 Tax=Anaplasma phagocytophilum TaxID=948 RepID=A0AA45UTI6_ANAPH|nr:hypothetical protein ANAPC1_01049 [Anaplasma phagocytophilum]
MRVLQCDVAGMVKEHYICLVNQYENLLALSHQHYVCSSSMLGACLEHSQRDNENL